MSPSETRSRLLPPPPPPHNGNSHRRRQGYSVHPVIALLYYTIVYPVFNGDRIRRYLFYFILFPPPARPHTSARKTIHRGGRACQNRQNCTKNICTYLRLRSRSSITRKNVFPRLTFQSLTRPRVSVLLDFTGHCTRRIARSLFSFARDQPTRGGRLFTTTSNDYVWRLATTNPCSLFFRILQCLPYEQMWVKTRSLHFSVPE